MSTTTYNHDAAVADAESAVAAALPYCAYGPSYSRAVNGARADVERTLSQLGAMPHPATARSLAYHVAQLEADTLAAQTGNHEHAWVCNVSVRFRSIACRWGCEF